MPILVLNYTERTRLRDLYFRTEALGREYPDAREEIMTAIRCLKAVNSNAIEDPSIDPVFLQILLHNAGVRDKGRISQTYEHAYRTLAGQQEMLKYLEQQALVKEPLSISLLLGMHRLVFSEAWVQGAGMFRESDVSIFRVRHDPPPASHIQELLHQRFAGINAELDKIEKVRPENFERVLQLSATTHYLVAAVHPFDDGNGRMARALGDYVFLRFGMYYDVIMKDYRNNYLDALEECSFTDAKPLRWFLEFSYLETLERVSTFYDMARAADR
jgi:Fic family protein